ncbi:MAG: PilZ domain-containing protein, partial [Bdellovibrionota bacterium]
MTPRYRAPRVTLTPLHRIEFDAGGEHARIPLFNISISGVGLLHEPPIPFAVGSELPGELRVGGARYPVRLKIAHVTPKIVGASFIDRSDALKSAIESYFEYELAALTMAKVDPKYHKAEPDGDAHWIHGDRCDLFYVTRGDQLVRFRLTFLGNHFESTAEGGLLAGQLH